MIAYFKHLQYIPCSSNFEKMKLKIKIALLFFTLVFSLGYAQTRDHSAKTVLAIETYAFLKGQDAALKAVASQFPALRSQTEAADKKLEDSFGRAESNIRHYLRDELGAAHYRILERRLDSLLHLELKNPIAQQKQAEDFLKLLHQRTYFLQDTVLDKAIASFTYHDAPHEEIIDGHVQIFNTDGHPKAEDAAVKIPIPKSWLVQEAQMPQTIKQFTSFHGKGLEKIILMSFELPSEYKNIPLDKNLIAEIISPQAALLRTEALQMDGRPAMMAEIEENINGSMKIRMLQFMFMLDGRLYCLQGSIGPVDEARNLGPHLKKYEPLFRLVASTTDMDTY